MKNNQVNEFLKQIKKSNKIKLEEKITIKFLTSKTSFLCIFQLKLINLWLLDRYEYFFKLIIIHLPSVLLFPSFFICFQLRLLHIKLIKLVNFFFFWFYTFKFKYFKHLRLTLRLAKQIDMFFRVHSFVLINSIIIFV